MDILDELIIAPTAVYPHSSEIDENSCSLCQYPLQKSRRKGKTVKVSKTVYELSWIEANREFRRQYLTAALNLHNGNIVHTAKALGIVRRTLQIQMRAAGIKCPGQRK